MHAFSIKTAGVPQSNGTPVSDGRNAREAQELNKLSIKITEFLPYVIQYCHETSPDSIYNYLCYAWELSPLI